MPITVTTTLIQSYGVFVILGARTSNTKPHEPRSLEISKELDQQNKMLENVNTDFEEAIGGLDAVTRKTKELIKKSGKGGDNRFMRRARGTCRFGVELTAVFCLLSLPWCKTSGPAVRMR